MKKANFELGISIYLMVVFATIGLFPTCVLGIWAACGIAIYNCISVTTSVILLCIDKWGKCTSIKYSSFVMRVIWTVVQGIAITLFLIQLIGAPDMIWKSDRFDQHSPMDLDLAELIPCLIIVTSFLTYGIFKSSQLHNRSSVESTSD